MRLPIINILCIHLACFTLFPHAFWVPLSQLHSIQRNQACQSRSGDGSVVDTDVEYSPRHPLCNHQWPTDVGSEAVCLENEETITTWQQTVLSNTERLLQKAAASLRLAFPSRLLERRDTSSESSSKEANVLRARSSSELIKSSDYGVEAKVSNNSDTYANVPSTGVTRTFNFTLTRKKINTADGVTKKMIVVNGVFPGPTIEANWGDQIVVNVTNSIGGPEEGTAVHWHGLLQGASQWQDGVPGVSQTPIAPGKHHVYSFNATVFGTSWYHSHFSAQYADGAFGAVVVYGPSQKSYDEDLGPVLLSDYFHKPYFKLLKDVMGNDTSKVQPSSDNNLIMGKGNWTCTTQNSTCTTKTTSNLHRFSVTSGKTYRMRLINAGAAATQKFSIDSHNLTVIAYDFVPVNPYSTKVVTLGVGQRADILVKMNGSSTDNFWVRSKIVEAGCWDPTNQPYGLAILDYQNASTTAVPQSIAQNVTTPNCANDHLYKTVPYYKVTPGEVGFNKTIDMNFTINATNHLNWEMNKSSFKIDWNDPVLLLAKNGTEASKMKRHWNVIATNTTLNLRIIVNNSSPGAHPMHLHGHNFWILNSGLGTWDGSTIIRKDNPMRRDVHIVPENGYMVMQWSSVNPGVWPMHCHIAWHSSSGLSVLFLEQAKAIENINIPESQYTEYDDWWAYTNKTVVDQIDSGN